MTNPTPGAEEQSVEIEVDEKCNHDPNDTVCWLCISDLMNKAIDKAVKSARAAERERCAKELDALALKHEDAYARQVTRGNAAAIRGGSPK